MARRPGVWLCHEPFSSRNMATRSWRERCFKNVGWTAPAAMPQMQPHATSGCLCQICCFGVFRLQCQGYVISNSAPSSEQNAVNWCSLVQSPHCWARSTTLCSPNSHTLRAWGDQGAGGGVQFVQHMQGSNELLISRYHRQHNKSKQAGSWLHQQLVTMGSGQITHSLSTTHGLLYKATPEVVDDATKYLLVFGFNDNL